MHFLQWADVNELMPGRSVSFVDVLWPRFKYLFMKLAV